MGSIQTMKASSDLRLHHIGIVVPVIEEHSAFYVDALKYQERTAVIHDPVRRHLCSSL